MANKAYVETIIDESTGDINYPRVISSYVLDNDGTPIIPKLHTSTEDNARSIETLNQNISSTTSRIASAETAVGKMNTDIGKNTTAITKLNKDIAALEKVVDSNAEKLAAAAQGAEVNAEKASKLDNDIEKAIYLKSSSVAEYKAAMKDFFMSKGCNALTPTGLTALCERWYNATKTGWSGSTEFYQPGAGSSTEFGTKLKDNAGMICQPSTNTEAKRDDYSYNHLFAVTDCNWEIDPTTLDIVITAIDGITNNFERNNINKYVGVMQMTPWHYYDERETTYTHGVSDSFEIGHDYCEPVPEAVRVDGTVRPFVVHSKYVSGLINNKLTACAGVIPRVYSFSHNTLQTYSKNNGTGYSGASIMDYAFLQLMTMIKYGSMSLDGVIQGAVNNNKQAYAIVAETGASRVILSTTDAAYFEVGMSCLVGNYTSSTDRGNAGVYSLSGQNGAIIDRKEIVDGGVALYFKMFNADGDYVTPSWDTGANGSAKAGSTIVSTWHWVSGSNDDVLGNDGSKDSPGSGKYAGKLQGIEFAVGCYEVMADVILNQDASDYSAHVCNLRSNQATSITANYTDIGLRSPKNSAGGGWEYIRKLGFAKGVFFGVDTKGGSSTTFTRDAFYKNGTSTTSGTREWLAFGFLIYGSGNGGLSCLYGHGLSIAYWGFGSRLSCNGNRGEFVA